MFSSLVLAHWIPDSLGDPSDGGVAVTVDAGLSANRSVSLLRVPGRGAVLSLSPERAGELAVTDGERLDDAEIAARMMRAGVSLHDPDNVFYLTLDDQAALRVEARDVATRRLTPADGPAFRAFRRGVPEDELDEAFVELDHWLVVGTFVGDELVCATSAYPWDGTRLADVGVVTRPESRGQGLGRTTVRAISADVLARGYEPQYRCSFDNTASAALARSAGFTRFATWEVVETDH